MVQISFQHIQQVDPVSIDATIQFRELELMERTRYNDLRNSAQNSNFNLSSSEGSS